MRMRIVQIISWSKGTSNRHFFSRNCSFLRSYMRPIGNIIKYFNIHHFKACYLLLNLTANRFRGGLGTFWKILKYKGLPKCLFEGTWTESQNKQNLGCSHLDSSRNGLFCKKKKIFLSLSRGGGVRPWRLSHSRNTWLIHLKKWS